MATTAPGATLPIPAQVRELTAEWFSCAPTSGLSEVPDTLFVKLQRFTQDQRELLRQVGLGVAEARVYVNIGGDLPVRVPRGWHSAYAADEGAFVMCWKTWRLRVAGFPPHPTTTSCDLHAAYVTR